MSKKHSVVGTISTGIDGKAAPGVWGVLKLEVAFVLVLDMLVVQIAKVYSGVVVLMLVVVKMMMFHPGVGVHTPVVL